MASAETTSGATGACSTTSATAGATGSTGTKGTSSTIGAGSAGLQEGVTAGAGVTCCSATGVATGVG